MPRHSPYALFRLNSRFAFSPFCLTEIWNKSSFYCLSFANNCILWVVRSKKTMIFRSYDFVLSASRFLSKPTKLFPLLLYGKTYTFHNKFFSITTICFVSFLYSVFNEHLPFHSSLLPFTYFHKRKWIVKSEEVISEFPFAFAYENSGRPKWTRTTFKNLSLQKRCRFFRVKREAS